MNLKTGTSVPKTQPIDKLIAELGPKHEQTIVTLFFASGDGYSKVLQGDITQAQEIVKRAKSGLELACGRITSVQFKAVTR